jgi:hypothetical protein
MAPARGYARAATSPYAAIVVLENGVPEAGLTEAVARIEHVDPTAMPIDVRIRDHH